MDRSANPEKQKMTKVCVVNPNFYRSSGVTIAIPRIYEGSKDLPVEWLFCGCNYKTEHQPEDTSWIGKDSEKISARIMTNNPYVFISEYIKLASILKSRKFDIIHTHHRRIAIILRPISVFLNIPIIYTGQLTYEYNKIVKLLLKAPLGTAITKSVSFNMKETTSIKHVEVISNPAIVSDSIQNTGQERLRTIGCIARLDEVKNHRTLLKAWALVDAKQGGWKLKLIGEGPLKNDLIQLASELGIQETVEFAGYTSDIKGVIEQCIFLTLASWREGQGIVTLEGAGLGRASLVTDVDGSRDCVPPTVALPNLIPPDSHLQLSEALKRWMENPLDAVKEGEKFYEYWKNEANPPFIANKYLSIYSKARSSKEI